MHIIEAAAAPAAQENNMCLNADMKLSDEGSHYHQTPHVGDFKTFFGLEAGAGTRAMPKFVGLGTTRAGGIRRKLHAFRLRRNLDGHVVLHYKEHDDSTGWRSHYDGSTELRIFNGGKMPSVLVVFPRICVTTCIFLCRSNAAPSRLPPGYPARASIGDQEHARGREDDQRHEPHLADMG
jgi:hypothetical protein